LSRISLVVSGSKKLSPAGNQFMNFRGNPCMFAEGMQPLGTKKTKKIIDPANLVNSSRTLQLLHRRAVRITRFRAKPE
jgi:hypothetical protein